MKQYFAFVLIAFSSVAFAAQDLTDKSTRIGPNPLNPENIFVKCVVRLGIEAAFGPKRSPWVYSYDEAIGSDPAPEVVAIGFIDRDAQDTREIHEVRLTSTDPEKKWQYVQSEQDTFFYSTRVSATAAITTKDGKAELAKFDISGCQ
jgi:hypothetical protein